MLTSELGSGRAFTTLISFNIFLSAAGLFCSSKELSFLGLLFIFLILLAENSVLDSDSTFIFSLIFFALNSSFTIWPTLGSSFLDKEPSASIPVSIVSFFISFSPIFNVSSLATAVFCLTICCFGTSDFPQTSSSLLSMDFDSSIDRCPIFWSFVGDDDLRISIFNFLSSSLSVSLTAIFCPSDSTVDLHLSSFSSSFFLISSVMGFDSTSFLVFWITSVGLSTSTLEHVATSGTLIGDTLSISFCFFISSIFSLFLSSSDSSCICWQFLMVFCMELDTKDEAPCAAAVFRAERRLVTRATSAFLSVVHLLESSSVQWTSTSCTDFSGAASFFLDFFDFFPVSLITFSRLSRFVNISLNSFSFVTLLVTSFLAISLIFRISLSDSSEIFSSFWLLRLISTTLLLLSSNFCWKIASCFLRFLSLSFSFSCVNSSIELFGFSTSSCFGGLTGTFISWSLKFFLFFSILVFIFSFKLFRYFSSDALFFNGSSLLLQNTWSIWVFHSS